MPRLKGPQTPGPRPSRLRCRRATAPFAALVLVALASLFPWLGRRHSLPRDVQRLRIFATRQTDARSDPGIPGTGLPGFSEGGTARPRAAGTSLPGPEPEAGACSSGCDVVVPPVEPNRPAVDLGHPQPRRRIVFAAGDPSDDSLPEMSDLGHKDVIGDIISDGSSDVIGRMRPTHEELLQLLEAEEGYSGRVAQAMGEVTARFPYLRDARANAVIFALCRNRDMWEIVRAVERVDWSFNGRFLYPYVFVNDAPFEKGFKRRVRAATKARVTFGLVPKEHWTVPGLISAEALNSSLQHNSKRYGHGGSLSYRLMCRYYSMYFFQHPLMLKYRYYMRIEGETDYACKLQYDPFLFMALFEKKYAFAVVAPETMETVTGIWKVTEDYMLQANISMSPFLGSFLDKQRASFNGIHFWNNFEMADLDFLRSREYKGYMDALEESKGFFLHRYGDATVRTLAVAMLLRPNETHYFVDLGYRHAFYKTCPASESKEGRRFKELCRCRRDRLWQYSDGNEIGWGMVLFYCLNNVNRLAGAAA